MVSLQRVGSLPPVNGGANRDGPDLSWKDWVTVPRQGAVKARRETRALSRELRFCRTLKYASGMTSTRWRAAAHYATGRLHSRFAGKARSAPPRHSGVLNKGLGFDRLPVESAWSVKPGRVQGTARMAPIKPVPVGSNP